MQEIWSIANSHKPNPVCIAIVDIKVTIICIGIIGDDVGINKNNESNFWEGIGLLAS